MTKNELSSLKDMIDLYILTKDTEFLQEVRKQIKQFPEMKKEIINKMIDSKKEYICVFTTEEQIEILSGLRNQTEDKPKVKKLFGLLKNANCEAFSKVMLNATKSEVYELIAEANFEMQSSLKKIGDNGILAYVRELLKLIQLKSKFSMYL